jgi:hypothetical protein
MLDEQGILAGIVSTLGWQSKKQKNEMIKRI